MISERNIEIFTNIFYFQLMVDTHNGQHGVLAQQPAEMDSIPKHELARPPLLNLVDLLASNKILDQTLSQKLASSADAQVSKKHLILKI